MRTNNIMRKWRSDWIAIAYVAANPAHLVHAEEIAVEQSICILYINNNPTAKLSNKVLQNYI